MGFAIVVLFHVILVAILLWQGSGLSDARGTGGPGSGKLTVFELAPPESAISSPRAGGGDRPIVAEFPGAQRRQAGKTGQDGVGRAKGAGLAVLGDELARLLAEDPLSGGGRLSYQTILQRHIAAHSRELQGSVRGFTGTVVVRFRVARDGRIVDARVLRSRGAELDEAALATLWRSEPLPVVPADLAAPLEVDVPIDFRARG